MANITMKNVSLGYGPATKRTEVLTDVNLKIEDNEFVAIIGFSGSGKSTLMSLLGGLEKPDTGQILLDDKPITGPGPDLGVVFQNYSLLPWMSVYGNIELAVKQVFTDMNKTQRRDCIQTFIDMVSLTNSEWKKPHELSGGMRQRLSLARTLAMKPQVLLLDEPLSALDALTRSVLQDEIIKIWEDEKRTVVMITNDVDEAILMADRIIPLTPGPNATLEKAFNVPFNRPRDRAGINLNPDFKNLRNTIANFMMGINVESKSLNHNINLTLPEIEPRHIA